jgi:hypothetical protein
MDGAGVYNEDEEGGKFRYNLTSSNKCLPVTKPVAIIITVMDGTRRNSVNMDFRLLMLM